MSFRDLDSELPLQPRQSPYLQNKEEAEQKPSRAVAAGISQYQTAVNSFYRLVNSLGTSKDTLELRDYLHKTRTRIQQLGNDIHAKLRQASEIDHHSQVSVVKMIEDAKLTKNFEAVLKDFQKAQRLAAERETSYAPSVPKQLVPSSYSPHEQEMSSARSPKQQAQLLESQRLLLSDNEIAFNEAIIEEREQGIQEIQQQIGEVNEIFKDLVVLVRGQRALIYDFISNVENTRFLTALILLVTFGSISLILVLVNVFVFGFW